MQQRHSLFFCVKRGFGVLLTVAVIAVHAASAFADTPSAPASIDTSTPAAAPTALTASSILDALPLARNALNAEVKSLTAKTPSPADVTFAVWNKTNQSITLYHATKSGSKFLLKEPADFKITANTSRYTLSPYVVSSSDDAIVSTITTATTKIALRHHRYALQYHRIISTPLSPQFFTPEVFAAGSDYLSDAIAGAFTRLNQADIHSKAFPDKLVTAVVDPYLMKAIVVSEHTSNLGLSDANAEGTLETLLVRLAIDRGNAFNQSVSTAGAAGLVQFISSTYKVMVKNNPAYQLNPNFQAGMNDHVNAIKAETALLDADLASLPSSVRTQFAANNFQTVAAYLGASYNGGSLRVQRALAYWGADDWMKSHAAEINPLAAQAGALKRRIPGLRAAVFASKTKKAEVKYQTELNGVRAQYNAVSAKLGALEASSLKAETVNYIIKIEKVYDMFSAGMYSTPHAPGALPVTLTEAQAPTVTASAPAQATASSSPEAAATSPSSPICFPDQCLAMK